jgi:anti-sigma B factor antagonist
MDSFSVNAREAGSAAILELSGRMTAGDGCDLLKNEVQSVLSAGRLALLLECREVTAIDSQGIQVLVWAMNLAAKHGAKLKLLKVSPRMKEALDLTRLSHRIESFTDEEAALRSFAS